MDLSLLIFSAILTRSSGTFFTPMLSLLLRASSRSFFVAPHALESSLESWKRKREREKGRRERRKGRREGGREGGREGRREGDEKECYD